MKGKIIGNWWSDKSIDLLQMEDGKVYALNNWNGECWLECWECLGKYHIDSSEVEYTIIPIYKREKVIGYNIL